MLCLSHKAVGTCTASAHLYEEGWSSPRLTTPTCHQGCSSMVRGSVGRNSFAMLLFTRHSSFLALHLFMVAMYSFLPMPTMCTMSAACRGTG